jgi:hypothetical protein
VVGYHRYDTAAELSLLNQIYALVRLHVNFFSPQQKLISKTRYGAKVIKRYDLAQTPYQRVLASPHVSQQIKNTLTAQYRKLNPAQIRRDILTLSGQLLDLVKAKHQPTRTGPTPPPATRASSREATTRRSRAS